MCPYNFLSLFFIVNPMAFKIRFCNIFCSYWWFCFMHCNEKSFLVVHSTIYFAFSLIFDSFFFEVWLRWCYCKTTTFHREEKLNSSSLLMSLELHMWQKNDCVQCFVRRITQVYECNLLIHSIIDRFLLDPHTMGDVVWFPNSIHLSKSSHLNFFFLMTI